MTHSSSGPGYDKALYYPISEESGGKVLHDIRSRLEAVVPRYLPQSFIPHVTVAEIYNGGLRVQLGPSRSLIGLNFL